MLHIEMQIKLQQFFILLLCVKCLFKKVTIAQTLPQNGLLFLFFYFILLYNGLLF